MKRSKKAQLRLQRRMVAWQALSTASKDGAFHAPGSLKKPAPEGQALRKTRRNEYYRSIA